MEDNKAISNIEKLFEMFSGAAMNPRPYVKKNPLPARVTVPLAPQEMELLQIIAARIGSPRTSVGHHILKLGLHEAARGCGFTFDEEGNISADQMKWETTPRTTGFSFPRADEEVA